MILVDDEETRESSKAIKKFVTICTFNKHLHIFAPLNKRLSE
jgi:hypothetical protein